MDTFSISSARNGTEKAKADAVIIPFLYLLCSVTSGKS